MSNILQTEQRQSFEKIDEIKTRGSYFELGEQDRRKSKSFSQNNLRKIVVKNCDW